MDLLAALSVTMRTALIVIAVAMVWKFRREWWAVLRHRPGWKPHLSTFILTVMVVGGAIISSVNIFPDAGLSISRNARLGVVNFGLAVFLIGTLTGLYRRATKSGPDKARAAFLSGLAMLLPGVALVWLLVSSGTNG